MKNDIRMNNKFNSEDSNGRRSGIPGDKSRFGGYYFASKYNEEERANKKEKIKSRAIEIIGDALSSLSNAPRANIARYIKKKKTATFGELRSKFIMNNNNLNFHLKKLQKAYIISQCGEKGSYKLGELGEVMLNFIDALEEDVLPTVEQMITDYEKKT